MAIEYSLTTAEAGRILDQKIKRGVIKMYELSTDEYYALLIYTALELGTFEALKP